MSYKTILVHVDSSAQLTQRVEVATALAIRHDAHLIGAAMTGVSAYGYIDRNIFFEEELARIAVRANQSLEQFEKVVNQMGTLSYERRLIRDEQAAGIVLQGRYADLIVLQREEEGGLHLEVDLPEQVLIHTGKPILLLPRQGKCDFTDLTILVAWNGSLESSRAIGHAIPFLQRAKQVVVVTCLPAFHYTPEQEADVDMAAYLSRHDINVDLVQIKSAMTFHEALLKTATDRGAGLIVMGGYGRTRFRELMLGGVTLGMMREATVPLFLSH